MHSITLFPLGFHGDAAESHTPASVTDDASTAAHFLVIEIPCAAHTPFPLLGAVNFTSCTDTTSTDGILTESLAHHVFVRILQTKPNGFLYVCSKIITNETCFSCRY